MPSYIGVSGVWKGVTGQWIGFSGVWKQIVGEWIGVGGVWKPITGAFSASATPTSVSGTAFVPSTVTTAPATATPSGGVGPYTYAWTRVSGSAGTAANPTGASTAFQAVVNSGTGGFSATFQCTVTDTATGLVVTTNTVFVLFIWAG